jgi:hypothetical protein
MFDLDMYPRIIPDTWSPAVLLRRADLIARSKTGRTFRGLAVVLISNHVAGELAKWLFLVLVNMNIHNPAPRLAVAASQVSLTCTRTLYSGIKLPMSRPATCSSAISPNQLESRNQFAVCNFYSYSFFTKFGELSNNNFAVANQTNIWPPSRITMMSTRKKSRAAPTIMP